MGANEKSDYQAEFFPDAVSEEERKLFLRNNFQGGSNGKEKCFEKVRQGRVADRWSILASVRGKRIGWHLFDLR